MKRLTAGLSTFNATIAPGYVGLFWLAAGMTLWALARAFGTCRGHAEAAVKHPKTRTKTPEKADAIGRAVAEREKRERFCIIGRCRLYGQRCQAEASR